MAVRAKGASSRRVLVEHAVPNSINPVLTLSGTQLGQMIGSAVLVETVFARQGVGTAIPCSTQLRRRFVRGARLGAVRRRGGVPSSTSSSMSASSWSIRGFVRRNSGRGAMTMVLPTSSTSARRSLNADSGGRAGRADLGSIAIFGPLLAPDSRLFVGHRQFAAAARRRTLVRYR